MSEDQQYLLACYVIYLLTLAFCIYKSKTKLRKALVNLGILLLYSTYFLYNLQYNGEGGTSLAWLIYLMFVIGLHWLINLVTLLVQQYRTWRTG